MELFPQSYALRANSFKLKQFGLWYDRSVTLLVGFIDDNGFLKGRVKHNGTTQKDCDEGRYFSAWNTGYTYDRWDLHDVEYVGTLRNYTSLAGYLEFLETATYDQMKAYFKTKELLIDAKII